MIRLKSAFEPKSPSDGYRILIEPVWPHALPKGKAAGVDWMRELYPSPDLRDWMRRNRRKAATFRERYLMELAHREAAVRKVCRMQRERGSVTVLTVPTAEPWEIHETLVSYLKVACEE